MSLPVYLNKCFRIFLPIICLFGSAPTFFIIWFLLRLTSLILLPTKFYRCCDDHLYSIYQRSVLFFFEHWMQIKIYFRGDHEKIFAKKENVLYISNHQSSVDWVIANMLAIRQGSLGHIRYVLKSDLKWIPLYGFYFQEHGCIYVNRSDKKDLERVERGIRQIQSNGLPVWLVIFPEGTRFNTKQNPSAIERSKDFSKQRGVEPFEHVLYPRFGATVASINALKDKLDAVYDLTVVYGQTFDEAEGTRSPAPSMSEYFQGKISELIIHVERVPMENIPKENNEQISNWLYQRFQIKDRLLKDFYRSKKTESKTKLIEGTLNELPLTETLYSYLFFVFSTIFLLMTVYGRIIYMFVCLFGSPICFLWMNFFPPRSTS